MPDITPAQIAAVAGWIVAQLVAFGLIDNQHEQLAVSVGATILGAAWKIADGYLRAHRALAVAQNANILKPPGA
jgi:hypothetical protein